MRTLSGIALCGALALGCGSNVEDLNLSKPQPQPQGTSVTHTVNFPELTIAPGTERTQCIVTKLGNVDLIRVHQIHNVLPAGSHHLIIYRTVDTEEKLTPYDCTPFLDTLDPSKGSTIMVTQKHDETLTLPEGVAFSMSPDQMVRLEMHYINTTQEPLSVSATSTFVTIPEEEYKHEADFLFIGNPDIDIAPHSKMTLGPTFFGLPDDLVDSKFFGITGHTHQWGTNVTVAAADTKDGPDKPIYDVPGWLWSEPETVMHDPPFVIPQNGGFRFTCEYNNMGDQNVGFGESANDEMCFFWAYYYPSKGGLVCVHTTKIGGGYDMCCPGNSLCGFLGD
jgi:hypothetical protein